MARHVAVIDLGKTNSKVALVDTATATELTVVRQAAATNSQSIYPSLDHHAINAFIAETLRKLSATQVIDAITVTTHGATAALLDKNGELALPVLDYEYSDIDELRTEYDQHRPPFADTGSPSLPGGLNIGAQLFWQRSRFPSQFMAASTLLTWPQYWIYKLTGNSHNDVSSLGCHTDLYEPCHQRYSTLVDNMNWRSLMPPTRLSGQLSGTLLPSVANSLGLPPCTPVYTGIHDSNASLVPHLLTHQTPFSVVSTGTWFVVMASGGASIPLDERKDSLLNVNAHGSSVPSARFMGGRERELLQVSNSLSEEAMDSFLGDPLTPMMLMPSVVPGTGPYPLLKHKWVRSSTIHEKYQQDCAVTLYLALMTNECMQLIGSDGPTYIEGPLAKNLHYVRMLTAVSKRPVYVSASETGTSVGAAMLISPPDKAIAYTPVELSAELRSSLEGYARMWQKQLQIHAR